mmetsp:Transcript_2539/g.4298  ORF Transcript_2539/g.4298 Transcript_2539/m.4298 type:complete len:191 (+) Transcript_2539:53-625(+)
MSDNVPAAEAYAVSELRKVVGVGPSDEFLRDLLDRHGDTNAAADVFFSDAGRIPSDGTDPLDTSSELMRQATYLSPTDPTTQGSHELQMPSMHPPQIVLSGLSLEEFTALPKVRMPQSLANPATRQIDARLCSTCPICIEDLAGNERLVLFGCEHKAHEECGRLWLQQTATCPECRSSVRDWLERAMHED